MVYLYCMVRTFAARLPECAPVPRPLDDLWFSPSMGPQRAFCPLGRQEMAGHPASFATQLRHTAGPARPLARLFPPLSTTEASHTRLTTRAANHIIGTASPPPNTGTHANPSPDAAVIMPVGVEELCWNWTVPGSTLETRQVPVLCGIGSDLPCLNG